MVKVLLVCTGNICRSPTGEGVFRHLLAEEGLSDHIITDSCGLESWHVGKAPDPRTIAAAAKRGVDLSELRARQIQPDDFHDFDLLLAMDGGHFNGMRDQAPKQTQDKIRMFLEPVAEAIGRLDVPDPYYGGADGFEDVLDLIEAGSRAWISNLRNGFQPK
ncbi:low molecular weight protein-tyrosine-phosphatase [Aestuariispira ectoiniformans]|uniref:low molecular weight protein-tyrosine-phosphatase n=1 Tax=Aestuariispira ectoiniformans TaxID=2775080 RepID=UPI00223A7EBC|nr:low molecular weight protein-tyrosine-phosphatase [Aestuariispira ectoiniformans]